MSTRSFESPRFNIVLYFILLGSSVAMQPLPAQNPLQIPRDLHQYSITKWGSDDGLPQLTVSQVLRTSDGFLWLGTQKGLSRFDGVHFENFTPEQVPALADGFICDLFEDSRGQLWIATRSGGVLRYAQGQFEAITKARGLADNYITAIAEDSQGRIWLGSASGISVFWRDQVSNYGTQDGLPANGVTDLAITEKDEIWVGTREGLRLFVDGRFEAPINFPDNYHYAHVNALHVDDHQQIWALFEGGLLQYADQSWTVNDNRDSALPWEFNAIAIDHKQSVWLGTTIHSLAQFDGNAITQMAFSEALIGRRIHAMTFDQEQNLWLGTSYGLVQIREPKTFAINENQGLSYNMVTPLLVDRQRQGIWIGTNGGGLNFYSNGQTTSYGLEQGLQSQAILSLALQPNGNLWVGSRIGLSVLENGTFRHFSNAEGLSGDYVRALTFDDQNRLWIGTREGLFVYKDGTFKLHPDMQKAFVRTLYLDRSNQVWVGTNNGLYLWDEAAQNFRHFTTEAGLESLFVRAIYEDLKGNFWVGTYGGGLHLKVDDQFYAVQESDGLHSNIVFDIRDDARENLWFSALKGVQKIPIQHLVDYIRGKRKSIKPQLLRLRNSDGNFAECNGGFYPAGASLPDGAMLYPTTNGVGVIDPEMADTNYYHPAVVLTSIAVDGNTLAKHESFEVTSETEKIEFHFTSLSLTRSAEIQFKVKLEGFDRDWEHIQNRRYHYYTSLPPGQYTFRVMATNADGVWSDQSAVVSFIWQPTLYETVWFWLLSVALLLVMIVLAFQWRMLHLHQRERQLQALVDKRTLALTEANRELTEMQERLVRSAHFAGMAEIATNVLHTVGNELNSVYVSISLIEQKTKKLRVLFPKKVASLLQQHRDNFPVFLKEDPKGQKLIPTLDGMTDLLIAHQQIVYKELDALSKKITNINNVVRSLPEHAEVGSFFERLSLIDLIEEAISMQRLSLQEHNVTLQRNFDYQPIIKVQKTKFLQVLVNLIKNAWEAALETTEDHPKVSLVTRLGEDGRVILEVSDNGGGIEESEVKRIFNQGYTTKEKGNGFGLHFSGNVVAEMKGHIDVRSRGKNCGATFKLDLPTLTEG